MWAIIIEDKLTLYHIFGPSNIYCFNSFTIQLKQDTKLYALITDYNGISGLSDLRGMTLFPINIYPFMPSGLSHPS